LHDFVSDSAAVFLGEIVKREETNDFLTALGLHGVCEILRDSLPTRNGHGRKRVAIAIEDYTDSGSVSVQYYEAISVAYRLD
jgi:hypothetical protein